MTPSDPIAALRRDDPRYNALDAYAADRNSSTADALEFILAAGPSVTLRGDHCSEVTMLVSDALDKIASDIEGRTTGIGSGVDRSVLRNHVADLRRIIEVVQPVILPSSVPKRIGSVIESSMGRYWTRFTEGDRNSWIASDGGGTGHDDDILAMLRSGAKVLPVNS